MLKNCPYMTGVHFDQSPFFDSLTTRPLPISNNVKKRVERRTSLHTLGLVYGFFRSMLLTSPLLQEKKRKLAK
ncbi:hypothetical protein Hanom_Chr16g01434811 [Helianthus anomalus]